MNELFENKRKLNIFNIGSKWIDIVISMISKGHIMQ